MNARRPVLLGGLAQKGADMNEIADLLDQIGEIALIDGIRAGFHNHTGHAAETVEDVEALFAKTDPAKVFGFLDIGHTTKDFAGHPVERRATLFLERNWEGITFIEFKDWSETIDLNTEVGAGQCDDADLARLRRAGRRDPVRPATHLPGERSRLRGGTSPALTTRRPFRPPSTLCVGRSAQGASAGTKI